MMKGTPISPVGPSTSTNRRRSRSPPRQPPAPEWRGRTAEARVARRAAGGWYDARRRSAVLQSRGRGEDAPGVFEKCSPHGRGGSDGRGPGCRASQRKRTAADPGPDRHDERPEGKERVAAVGQATSSPRPGRGPRASADFLCSIVADHGAGGVEPLAQMPARGRSKDRAETERTSPHPSRPPRCRSAPVGGGTAPRGARTAAALADRDSRCVFAAAGALVRSPRAGARLAGARCPGVIEGLKQDDASIRVARPGDPHVVGGTAAAGVAGRARRREPRRGPGRRRWALVDLARPDAGDAVPVLVGG